MRTRKIGQRKQLVSQIICGNDHLVEFSLTKRFIILRFTQVAEGCEVLLFMLPLLPSTLFIFSVWQPRAVLRDREKFLYDTFDKFICWRTMRTIRLKESKSLSFYGKS